MKRLTMLSASLLALTAATGATAETTECTVIASIPTVLASPGVYCLNSDLMTAIASGAAIDVTANFVTIDLNGWRLGGGAAGPATTAVGIRANGRRGVTVRNGSVKGFHIALQLGDSGTTHLVEDVRADGNTTYGILLASDNSILRNNQISNTGGRTGASTDTAYGIYSTGISNRIEGNGVTAVTTTKSASPAVGIVSWGAHSIIAGNQISAIHAAIDVATGISVVNDQIVVSNRIADGSAPGGATGISAIQRATVRDNMLTGFATGITMLSGVYSGNVVMGASLAYSGGNAHGTTNWP